MSARPFASTLVASEGALEAVETRCGSYEVRATYGQTPEELWLGIQQRMGELEGVVAASQDGVALVVVDGPLSHRRHVERLKAERADYLAEFPGLDEAIVKAVS